MFTFKKKKECWNDSDFKLKKKASYSVCAAYTLTMFKSHDTCLTSSTHQKRPEDQLIALDGKGKRQKKEHSS